MTVSTILEGVKTYLKTYSGLTSELVEVNSLDSEPVRFSLVPLAGARVLETYIDGASVREYPFALQADFRTDDDVRRIANYGFYESFSAWIETQNDAGTLPTLPTGMTSESIEVLDQPVLFQQGESGTGVYQVQCKLTYTQVAP